VLLILAAVFAGLRGVAAVTEPPGLSPIATDRVVVVGVTGRPQLTATDREVLGAHLDDAQVGTISIRTRYVAGNCAAAGWTTLGAGRRTGVDGRCDPQVSGGRVLDWPARTAASAARNGDARLGTLAGSVPGCVAAVGPGAALAAARPDGSVADYRTAAEFAAAELATSCPITLVDAAEASEAIIRTLANTDGVTLIVAGIGPAPGSADRSLQVVYRLGAAFPGWLTSASTRREGIVTLTDLTRTLIDFGRADPGAEPLPVDGSPLAADPAQLTLDGISSKIDAVAALSDAVPIIYRTLGIAGIVLLGVTAACLLVRRLRPVRMILTVGCVVSAAMMLTGAVPWPVSRAPAVLASLAIATWASILAAVAVGLGRLTRAPAAIVAAGLTVAAFTVDAALGAPMQAGSLLNSRPIYGLRWYGFGNSTFAAYATAGLVLAGYVAHRLLAAGHRRAALTAVAAIGFGIVAVQGWPSMGADFGGVLTLTPAVLWLLLILSGVRLRGARLGVLAGSAVLAVALISGLDWSRGPDRRTHLGNFVQRILDGDAPDVISRKAVASAETIASPFGIGAIAVGAAAWVVLFRLVAPAIAPRFSTVRPVLVAVLIIAVGGTLLNDAGIGVWAAVTAALVFPMAWLWVDHLIGDRGTALRAAAVRR
jgi:hypothetical protein